MSHKSHDHGEGIPSERTVPSQKRYHHGNEWGTDTTTPLNSQIPDNPLLTGIPIMCPSRFNEFMFKSHTNGKDKK